mmetsp:Transcript_146517/g.272866  ORF Transcript_146517/g.272866 Transcript_146517/m.272866 type:complete len:245 (-) Transcript_146517:248-982(-)
MGRSKQALRRSHRSAERQDREFGSVVEHQNRQECGLRALRNMLMPYDIGLPSERELRRHAVVLEGEEADLLEDDDTGLFADAERADADGNFSVDVLMLTVMQYRIHGSRVRLEYWNGHHREASHGRELGFILGNGMHWWCIRPSGPDPLVWEEVDSLGQSHIGTWSCIAHLLESLGSRDNTILVLYPAEEIEEEEEKEEEEEQEDGEGQSTKLKRVTKKAEAKEARKREKEARKLARQKQAQRV